MSLELLVFDSLAVWDPGDVLADPAELTVAVGVHAGLPVLTLAGGAPGLAQGRPVVGNLQVRHCVSVSSGEINEMFMFRGWVKFNTTKISTLQLTLKQWTKRTVVLIRPQELKYLV